MLYSRKFCVVSDASLGTIEPDATSLAARARARIATGIKSDYVLCASSSSSSSRGKANES
jgi:hypothetical protein